MKDITLHSQQAESWAGFANDNAALYPFCFGEGGSVSFTGAAGFGDVDVFFRFENAPYPDTDPAFDTGTVTVSGGDDAAYSVSVPAQDAANTYSSFIMYVVTQDTAVIVKDVQVTSTDCASDPVDPVDPVDPAPSTVSVTFQVDMSALDTHPDGVYLAGGGVFGQDGLLMMITAVTYGL